MTAKSSSQLKKTLKKLFISHANPEDNYFAKWLATKLTLLGYDVWCDVEELKGGEDFWADIEQAIRNESIKFLFVITAASITKRGTLKELAVADKIRDRGDFLIPLRLEAIAHDTFPVELIRLNALDFSTNWAPGFTEVLEKLEADRVPRQRSFATDQIRHWWQSGIGQISNALINREERYWSNWFPCEMPQAIYIHRTANTVSKSFQLPYPHVVLDNAILSFACGSCLSDSIDLVDTVEIKLDDFLVNKAYSSGETGITVTDTNNKVIELMNLAFIQCAHEKGLIRYELSQGTAMYFPTMLGEDVSTTRVKLDKYDLTHVSLTGKAAETIWHYGIQGRAFLFPQPILGISHHIIFTHNQSALEASQQHKLRRKVGKDWYNKQWRDRLLASLLLLSDSDTNNIKHSHVVMPVCCKQQIRVQTMPLQFFSAKGYFEPA